MANTIYIDNTGVVELDELKNSITDEFINDASVTATIQLNGVDVEGQAWPLALDYVTASDGKYRGLSSADLVLLKDRTYSAIVEAVAGSLEGKWICKVVAQERPCGAEC